MKILLIMLALILSVPPVFAATDYEIIFDIQDNEVYVTHKANVEIEDEIFLSLLPDDAIIESITLEGAKIDIDDPMSPGFLIISFKTKSLIEDGKNKFFVAESFPLISTQAFTTTLVLEAGAVLETPLAPNGLQGSVFPKPDSTSTDGVRTSFSWKRSESLSILVEYNFANNLNVWIFLVLIAGALVAVVIVLFFAEKRIVKPTASMPLKPDEKEIVRVLMLKKGVTSQATLMIATGLPKTTLSRVLLELENRGVIRKEAKGNKNIIYLSKGEWNVSE